MPKKNEVTAFVDTWIAEGYPIGDLCREHRFHPSRRWRFDIAWPSQKIAVEIDGFGFGHLSIAGRKQDNEKQNVATAMGWRVVGPVSTRIEPISESTRQLQQLGFGPCLRDVLDHLITVGSEVEEAIEVLQAGRVAE